MVVSNLSDTDRSKSVQNGAEMCNQCQHKEGLNELWHTGVHSDVRIHVKDKTFNCHKAVLVEASCYFDAMFASGMREALTGEIIFHDMEPNIFEIILEFVYTGESTVTEEYVIEALETSLLLDIKHISELCENLLVQNLTVENCMDILEFSYRHHCEGLKAEILAFILPNFMDVVKQDNFSNLRLDDLIELIKSDDLNVISEEVALESAIKWAEKKEGNVRGENLNQILAHLRLGHLSSETLLSLKTLGFPVSADAQAKLDEALEYKMLPARRQEMHSTVKQYRKSFPIEEVMVVVGSPVVGSPMESRETTFYAFSFLQQKWFNLPNIPYSDVEVAACCHGNDIFLFGGRREHSKAVLRYSAAVNKWTSCASLYKGRSRCVVAAMTEGIYLMGGFNIDAQESGIRILSSIEKYDTMTGRSEYCSDLPKPTYGSSAVVSGRKVFLFGEFYNSNTSTDLDSTHSCYMWNTVTNDWTLITELAQKSNFLRTVISDKRIFMVRVGKIVEFIEKENNCKLLTERASLSHAYYGAVPHEGHILIAGGRYKMGGEISLEILHFNTETSEMTNFSHPLPKPMLVNGCFKIEIDKKFLMNQADCGY